MSVANLDLSNIGEILDTINFASPALPEYASYLNLIGELYNYRENTP